jgi:hypothetical protein
MNDLTSKNSSSLLAAGGAGFLALAAIFLVRDLALPPETLLGVVALVASVAAILGRPRRWRWVAPGVLLAVTLVGGGWYLAVTSPALLPGLALAAFGSIAAVVLQERRASGAPSDAAVPLAWYAAGTACLVASAALYFHFLTLGFADESLARRLIPTIGWLAIGLALLIAARRPTSPPGRVGIGFVAVAAIKALAYDSTHLQGPLRITVFAAVGVLLLAGARLISDRERAA